MKIQPADAGIHPAPTRNAGRERPDTAQTESRPTAAEKLTPQAAQDLVKEMNQALQSINTGLEFSLHQETGKMVIKVIDLETKQTLRQFPSEEAIAVAQALERLQGVLPRQSA